MKCPKTREEIEARFTRLTIDTCIYRYEDVMGRIMLILHYVDDINNDEQVPWDLVCVGS